MWFDSGHGSFTFWDKAKSTYFGSRKVPRVDLGAAEKNLLPLSGTETLFSG
jgi:hypothetical protein